MSRDSRVYKPALPANRLDHLHIMVQLTESGRHAIDFSQIIIAAADLAGLASESPDLMEPLTLHHPVSQNILRVLWRKDISKIERLLVPVLHWGKLLYDFPCIATHRIGRETDLDRLDAGVKRFINPH